MPTLQWIKVSEQSPPTNEDLLVWIEDGGFSMFTSARWDGAEWFQDGDSTRPLLFVTHYARIEEPER